MPTKRRSNRPTPPKLFTRHRSLRGLLLIALLATMAAGSNVWAQSPTPTPQFVNPLIPSPPGNPAALGWTILLVAFVTASLVQLAKELWGLRGHVHQRIVKDWVRRRAESPTTGKLASEVRLKSDSKTETEPKGVLAHLEKLIGGTMESAGAENYSSQRRYGFFPFNYSLPAYSLPAEQLCGQLASAAEVVIAMPDRYPELFAVLIASGDPPPPGQIEEYVTKAKKRSSSEDPSGDPPTQPTSKETTSDDQRYADLRAQFMLRAQRSLDNLQITMVHRWRWWLTGACLGVSLLFGYMISLRFLGADPLFQGLPGSEQFTALLPSIVIVTIAGALIAPLAHDLTLAIRSFRRP